MIFIKRMAGVWVLTKCLVLSLWVWFPELWGTPLPADMESRRLFWAIAMPACLLIYFWAVKDWFKKTVVVK